jgi:hypothetical protein
MKYVIGWTLLTVGIISPAVLADDSVVPAGHRGHWRQRAIPSYPACPPEYYPWGPQIPRAAPEAPMPPVSPPVVPPKSPDMPPVVPPMTPEMPPVAPPPQPVTDPFTDPFAQAPEAGGQAARSFNENFDGDNVGVYYTRTIVTGMESVIRVVGTVPRVAGTTQTVVGLCNCTVVDPVTGQRVPVNRPIIINDPIIVQDPVLGPVVVAQRRTVKLPLAGRYNGVQITDNDSPRPTDRVYFGYNFYYDAGYALNPDVGGSNVQRQMAGFEKTFLGGDASFGMRAPFIQQYGPGGFAAQNFGDLSLLFKYAFYNDRATGDIISGGLVLTTPTGGGDDVVLLDGTRAPHSFLFQPWVGFVRMFDSGYMQGITNVIVPTDGRDPTLLGNSLAWGYFLYRSPSSRFLTGITPTAEVHVRTPLSNRDSNDLIFFQDQVNLTGGIHFWLRQVRLNTAVNVPVVGPRPWAVEAMAYLNWYF